MIGTIERPPAFEGFGGRAWRFDGRSIASWALHLPEVHFIWDAFEVSLFVHRTDETSTHFFEVWALHPEMDVSLYVREPGPQALPGRTVEPYVRPVRYRAALSCPSDEEAISRVEVCIRLMTRGDLSPFADTMKDWATLYEGGWSAS